MCGRITCQLRACTEDQKGTRVGPTKFCCDQVLLRAHTCGFQKKTRSFMVAPKGQRLYGVGRRTAAVSIHMCVWQNHMSTQGLHQGSKRYKSLADQLLLRAYTYVCQKQLVPSCTQGSHVTSSQGCTQGPRVTSVWPTACCCEHTHVCCKIKSIQGCTQGRHVTRVRPTRCCCEPTHMRCRIFLFNVARKGQKIICRCEHTYTHVCFRTSQFKLAHQNQEVQGLGQSGAAVSTLVPAAG